MSLTIDMPHSNTYLINWHIENTNKITCLEYRSKFYIANKNNDKIYYC
jgi:hypothetical protein